MKAFKSLLLILTVLMTLSFASCRKDEEAKPGAWIHSPVGSWHSDQNNTTLFFPYLTAGSTIYWVLTPTHIEWRDRNHPDKVYALRVLIISPDLLVLEEEGVKVYYTRVKK